MNEVPQPQSDKVRRLLCDVETDCEAILRLAGQVILREGTPMLPLDMFAIGAVKRSISTASGFRQMIKSWNMVCARSLLRIHVDTALRFSAAWLVSDPQSFAQRVLKGERIDKMKSQDGSRLTDSYLIEIRTAEYPWLNRVYKHLSGYVHFSGSHIYDSVLSTNKSEGIVEFEIAEFDKLYPESSWFEIVDCFREGTEFLIKYLNGYGVTKHLSPDQLAAMKGQQTFP